MNLVIVESPTKSKVIEKYLGKNYIVRASNGHLRDLPKSTMGINLPGTPDYNAENPDFDAKYINIRGKGDLIKALKNDAKKADKIFLATDPDREGEAISWHLAHILGIDVKAPCRVTFNAITKDTVTKSIKKPRTIDMDMVDAQQTRRILDRIVGYSLSPLLWRKLHIRGLSAGRVQSVAVKIVADRDAEIEAFIPQEYWTLNAKLRENSKSPIFEANVTKYKGKKLEMHNADEAHAVENALRYAAYTVLKAEKKVRKRRPAPPFTTSVLQQEANRKLNFTARKTMMVAQQLYEGVSLGRTATGLITYMRTDSVRLADEAIAEIRGYVANNMGAQYLPKSANHFSTKKNAQDAHEAIRPTSVMRTPDEVKAHLTADQLKLYTLIWRRTVACQMADALYDQTVLTIGAADYELNASGSLLTFPGWLEVYGKFAEEEKDKKVPYIEVGTNLKLHELMPAEQHFTEPPAHFTEASLIKYLEEHGIGRPSTYAPTIVTILARNYITKEGKKLLVTELGKQTLAMLSEHFKDLIDEQFSSKMETELDEIAEEKITMTKVLHDFYGPFKADLEKADENLPVYEPEPEVSDVVCDKCGRLMVYKDGKFGRFLACPGFPDCRNTKPILHKIGVKCPKCGGDILELKSKTGKTFYACENNKSCDFISWDKPLNETCDKCGGTMSEHVGLRGFRAKYCLNPACENTRPAPKEKTASATKAAAKKTTTARKTTAKKTTTSRKTATKKPTTTRTKKQ